MSAPVSKLFANLGFAIRLSKKLAVCKETTEHLHSAMHSLVRCMEDSHLERVPKRRRVVRISECLPRTSQTCHSSSQTESEMITVSEMRRFWEETREEIGVMITKNRQQYETMIADKDNIIASLRDQLGEVRASLLGPTPGPTWPKTSTEKGSQAENHPCADPAPSCAPGAFEDFVTVTDLLALSRVSWYHWIRYGPSHQVEEMTDYVLSSCEA